MLLSGVLFVLFLAGCWLYCLTDAAVKPAEAFPGWRKRTWIVVIAVTLIAGAIAWLIAQRNWRASGWPTTGTTHLTIDDGGHANVIWYPHWPTEGPTDAARSRHPAGRSMRSGSPGWTGLKGPDDDPEFLRQLAQRIHGAPGDPAE
jgi:hypothetical protein